MSVNVSCDLMKFHFESLNLNFAAIDETKRFAYRNIDGGMAYSSINITFSIYNEMIMMLMIFITPFKMQCLVFMIHIIRESRKILFLQF
jgi:hypothetical protein